MASKSKNAILGVRRMWMSGPLEATASDHTKNITSRPPALDGPPPFTNWNVGTINGNRNGKSLFHVDPKRVSRPRKCQIHHRYHHHHHHNSHHQIIIIMSIIIANIIILTTTTTLRIIMFPLSSLFPAYVQANRIAKRVIKMGGSNDFLAVKGSISVGVRDDFQQTKHGLKRKDALVFPAPPASST